MSAAYKRSAQGHVSFHTKKKKTWTILTQVYVNRAVPKESNPMQSLRTKKLFIGGVSPDMDPGTLREYLEQRHPPEMCGKIDKIDFIKVDRVKQARN